jgi:hypothetical protein
MTNPTNPSAAAERYFDRWMAGDFDAVRGLLADDVTFVGALGAADGVDECIAGLQGMSKMVTRVDVAHRWVDGDDVITWYDLHTASTDPIPTVNWMHMTSGRIDRIRVTFDPRPLLG